MSRIRKMKVKSGQWEPPENFQLTFGTAINESSMRGMKKANRASTEMTKRRRQPDSDLFTVEGAREANFTGQNL